MTNAEFENAVSEMRKYQRKTDKSDIDRMKEMAFERIVDEELERRHPKETVDEAQMSLF